MIEINWIAEGFDTLASISGKYGRWLNANGRRACFSSGRYVRSTGLYGTLG
jgi:hypothetical protein